MATQAEINKKAMSDVLALEESVGMFESFGSQLDLGLPSLEDDAPKSFEDMLEVNPTNEPSESGEYFMNEGDDLQDPMTQKFVVDKFAEELMKRPEDGISVEDALPDIAATIQGFDIKGDVASFIRNSIDRANQFMQAQNVSPAQPNGVTGADAAVTAEPGLDAGLEGDGIPAMEPIDPTAEPSLDANAGDVDPLAGIGDDLGGDLGADLGGDLGGEEPLPAEGDDLAGDNLGDDLGGGDLGAELGTDDLGDDLGGDLGGDDGIEDGDISADLEGDDDDLGGDEGEGKSEDKGEDDKEESNSDDDDADFNFEAIAKKARGLLEVNETGTETGATEGNNDAAVGTPAPETPAPENTETSTETPTDTDTSTDGGATELEECSLKAQVEAIAYDARLKMTAQKAKALVESYNKNEEKKTVMARLDSVMDNLQKKVVTESIIDNFAKQSAAKAQVESVTKTKKKAVKPTFESLMSGLNNAIDKSGKKVSLAKKANAIVSKFESRMNLDKKLNGILEGVETSINAKKTAKLKEQAQMKKIDSILEGVQTSMAKQNAANSLDDQLKQIVNDVKNA